MRRICLALLATLISICSVQLVRADEQLPKDPNNVYGQFDNGLKYIIRKNANPPGKVSLDLHVRTGALNETDQQNGLAHFIEHMAFNGGEHFPPGKLIQMFPHWGLTFGADINAHTNLWETVFKFQTPDNKVESIDNALNIFFDDADGLLLDKNQIERERGVILEEKRAGKSAAERLQRAMVKQIFAGTRLEIHDIIGDEDQIKHFPQSTFQDYWNTWYRPENMTLIVAGDVDPQVVIDEAKKILGPVKDHGDSRTAMKAGLKPFEAPKALVLTDPEQVGADMEMMGMKAARPPVTTFDQYRRETVESISEWIVNRRFDEIVRKGGAPFRVANVDTGDFLHEGLEVGVDSEGEPEDWSKMLDAQIVEVNRAIQHGFAQHELDLCKSEMLAGAQRAVDTESTRDSGQIVAVLARDVGTDRPILSAQQRLDFMKQILDTVTIDELHKVFTENFQTKNYAYVLMLPANKSGFKIPTTEDVLAAADAAWAKKPEAQEEKNATSTILATEPDAGKVASQVTDPDLQITNVTFENGVVMHHKFNDYKKDSVTVSMVLPGGELEETEANHGVSEVASLIVERPATSRLTSSQIRDLMTGKNVHVGGGFGQDALSLAVSGNNKDLPAGMQLAYALLTDGVLEQAGLDEWKKVSLQEREMMKTQPGGQIQEILAHTVLGGDPRFTPLTEEQIKRQELAPAQEWFKRVAGTSAIEVSVVGDIKLDDAVALVSRYVGSLPKRTGTFNALDSFRKLQRGNGPFEKTVKFDSVTPKALVVAGFISCDELDPERRPLSLAGRILSDRMIERIRQKERLVYSIGCSNRPSSGMPGTGMMISGVPTDPQNADKLGDTILEMLKDFADKGPTEDELTNAKKQTANDLDTQMKTPGFWLGQINTLTYHGRSMDDLKQLPAVYQTYTAEQVRDAVKKYCKDDSLVRLEAIPANSPTTKPASQSTNNDPRNGAP